MKLGDIRHTVRALLFFASLICGHDGRANDIEAKWRHASSWSVAELRSNARFASIVSEADSADGLARIGRINRAVNMGIKPASDLLQYGVEDYWASPDETLKSGRGDCEDYAILKMAALESIGIQSSLLIIRDRMGADHAVVEVNLAGATYILDNRTNAMATNIDDRMSVVMRLRRSQ